MKQERLLWKSCYHKWSSEWLFVYQNKSPPVIYFVLVWILKNDTKHKKRLQNDTKILFRFRLESVDYFGVYERGDTLEILAMIIEGDVRMKVKAYIASAFSKDNTGGNQAGIIFYNNRYQWLRK